MSNNNCLCCLLDLSPEELTILATIISLIISEGFEGCQREVIGNFILSIGQQIVSFSAQDNCLSK